ncbi:MAG: hypothetical protein OHK0045_25300 [Raineya sp.]
MDNIEIFKALITGLEKRHGQVFVKGNRNNFVYRLACACNRYGVPKDEFLRMASIQFQESGYTIAEIRASTESAYKNKHEHSKYSWKWV